MIRSKFRVTKVTELEGGMKSATLIPVTSGSEENKQFFKWTPAGSIELGTLNPKASEQFKPGLEFYVDFTPCNSAE